jgi:hypothetical protein
MNSWKIISPAVVLVALSLVPLPANAGQRRGGGGSRSGGGGGSRSGSAPRTSSSPRSFSSPRTFSGGRTFSSPRSFGPSRGYSSFGPSRGYIGSRAIGPRFGGFGYRSFSRPYYSFRSRFSLGFGLFVGYPIAFPYYYDYGYPYAYGYPYPSYSYGYRYPYYSSYPYPYSYYPDPVYSAPRYPTSAYRYGSTYPNDPQQAPSQGSVGVTPGSGQQDFGGVSFNITPGDAQVYVDGEYAGVVSNFSPTSLPLTLAPGRHHIEIRANGYQTMTFDSDVTRGQVIPYQGSMQR